MPIFCDTSDYRIKGKAPTMEEKFVKYFCRCINFSKGIFPNVDYYYLICFNKVETDVLRFPTVVASILGAEKSLV